MLILSILMLAVPAYADPSATLTAGDGTGHIGTYGVVVPISLGSLEGAQVAAMNFDLEFDNSVLTVLEVTLGEAAVAAEKEVHHAPQASGAERIIVFGLNDTPIGDGVIVNVSFDVSMSAAEGTYPVSFSNVVAAAPDATEVPVTTSNGTVVVSGQPTSFADVTRDHWAYGFIEALYQGGFIAGCQTEPKRLYCVWQDLTRSEMAVFVERGVNGSGYMPPPGTGNVFADMAVDNWGTKWAEQLYLDNFTAGCGTDPLIFCGERKHRRNEMTVFMERVLHGVDYTPPTPTVQHYLDVGIGQNETWDSKWVYAAFDDQIIQECEDEANRGDQYFRPLEDANRAEIACVLAKAKGLTPVTP